MRAALSMVIEVATPFFAESWRQADPRPDAVTVHASSIVQSPVVAKGLERKRFGDCFVTYMTPSLAGSSMNSGLFARDAPGDTCVLVLAGVRGQVLRPAL